MLAHRVSGVLVAAVIAALAAGVASAATANDPAFADGLQWGLEKVRAPAAWDHATGEGVTIAVVDSGVHLEHEDLEAKLVPGAVCLDTGGDPAKCGGTPFDDNGHGTHVAGIAAGVTGNGRGIAGIARDASIMPVKVLVTECSGCAASGRSSNVEAGIRWAADHGADVINLSLGSQVQAVLGPGFADAIEYAFDKGAISVVAAGNESLLPSGFSDEPAVVVTATDRADAKASYSNTNLGGSRWPISAPGGEVGDTPETCSTGGEPVGIISTYWNSNSDVDDYACLVGTSMAAPHVSGALAILGQIEMTALGRDRLTAPEWTVLIENYLLDTAVDIGPESSFGRGRLDIGAAAAKLAADRGAVTTTTVAAGTPTTVPGTQPPGPDGTNPSGGEPVPASGVTSSTLPNSGAPRSTGSQATPDPTGPTPSNDPSGPSPDSDGDGSPDGSGEGSVDDESAAPAVPSRPGGNDPAGDDDVPAPLATLAVAALGGAVALNAVFGRRLLEPGWTPGRILRRVTLR